MSVAPWQERTQLLLGTEALKRLAEAHVLVAGLGGVGGIAAEMLARAGVGKLTLVDADRVHPSNINRQILATHATVGELKVEVAAHRLRDINPNIEVHALPIYLEGEELDRLVSQPYHTIIDAIDTITPKVHLIKTALLRGTPLISSMGAGAKYDPNAVRIGSFWQSNYCHLARTIRRRLRKLRIPELESHDFLAVYSTELCDPSGFEQVADEQNKKTRAGIVSYIPNLFGCMAAGAAIQQLLAQANK